MNTEEKSHSEEQAMLQLESIKEMVAGLTREGAAWNYVKELSAERCGELLKDAISEDEWKELNGDLSEDDQLSEMRTLLSDKIENKEIEPDDFEFDFEFDDEKARQTIQEDALSVEVRSGWVSPGEEMKAEEFCILLCTGGPAVRIIGELDEYGQPDRARLQHQDWGTPWTEYLTTGDDNDALLTYCQQFYFGE